MKKGKKFIALFLTFSLMMLSVNLYAKERRGAKLIVTKTDGQKIRGELITVKPNSLLLLDTDGKDVSIDIVDIKVIRVVKKSEALSGAVLGILIGGAAGAALGYSKHDDPTYGTGFHFSAGEEALFFGIVFGGLGMMIGGIFGGVVGTDKKIRIEGMTDSEINEVLEKLRKKARIRDYK